MLDKIHPHPLLSIYKVYLAEDAEQEAFVEAFDGVGGVDSLIEWAKDNPDKFYPLLARLFPKEVAVESKSSADLHVSMLKMNRALRRIGKPEIQECED